MGEHISYRYWMSTIWAFEIIQNMHDVYRADGYMKKFCKSSREKVMKTINFEKKKMIPLTNEQQESYQKKKIVTFAKIVWI